jgi:hypothetical protein
MKYRNKNSTKWLMFIPGLLGIVMLGIAYQLTQVEPPAQPQNFNLMNSSTRSRDWDSINVDSLYHYLKTAPGDLLDKKWEIKHSSDSFSILDFEVSNNHKAFNDLFLGGLEATQFAERYSSVCLDVSGNSECDFRLLTQGIYGFEAKVIDGYASLPLPLVSGVLYAASQYSNSSKKSEKK